jgi:hypothetical protein
MSTSNDGCDQSGRGAGVLRSLSNLLRWQWIPTPKILPILVENTDMPDWDIDFGPERGSLARVEV